MGQREPFLLPARAGRRRGDEAALPRARRQRPADPDGRPRGGGAVPPNLENGLRLLERRRSARPRPAGSDTIVGGEDAFKLHSTYGIPVEVTESLAADQNLRRRHGRASRRRMEELGEISRGTTEAAAVFATGPLDTLKEVVPPRQRVPRLRRRPRPTATVIGILEQNRLAESADGASATPARRSSWSSTARRSTARRGGQVGDTGTIRGERFVFHVDDTKKDNDFIAPHRPGGRGDRRRSTTQVDGAGRRRPPRGDPPGPLGDARPAPRPAPPPGQARPAGRQQGRARPAPVRLRQPRGRRPRPAPRDRGDRQRAAS